MSDEQGMIATRPQSAQVATRGFGEQSIEVRDTAAVAVAERQRAEIQAMCIMAINRPRNLDDVRVRLLSHCKRTGFAIKARYSKPQGNTMIQGASIRFVETALQEYGNVLPEVSVVYEDAERIRVRVSVHDLERNIRHADEAVVPKRVERKFLAKGQVAISSRLNSHGEPVHLVQATDDEVAIKKASAASKLIRNLGLRILPADLVDEAMDLCIEVAATKAKQDPTAERKKVIDAFAALGVKPTQIAEYLEHPIDQMQPSELNVLRELYQAMRDGETTWHAVMSAKRESESPDDPSPPAPAPGKGTAGVKARLARETKPIGSAPVQPPATPAPVATPAVIDVPAREPDEFGAHVAKLHERLERVGLTNDLHDIIEQIARLPMGPERLELEDKSLRASETTA